MTALERHQVAIYFVAVLIGAGAGLRLSDAASVLEVAIWPVVGVLLYFTLMQMPLPHFRQALSDVRFLAAILTANFLFVPIVVWLLLWILPPSPPIHLGVALVLLTPCTDWMNTFTLLGKGDTHRTLAATPLLLITQIVLLPVFLWLLLESDTSRMVATRPFLQAFVGLVMLPLSLAWLGVNQRRAYPSSRRLTNAVSERFISPATACIQWSGSFSSSQQTAAGFPAKGRSVNASTCQHFIGAILHLLGLSLPAHHGPMRKRRLGSSVA